MQTTTGWAWWGGEEAKREWRKGGERGRRISSRGERNVALPRSDRKINRPGGKIKRLQTRREDEPRWFLGSRWSSLRATTEEKDASFEDDTSRYDMDIFRCPFNPTRVTIGRSLKKRKATGIVTYARAVHGSQSSLRGFVLFYAPQLEADRSTFSTSCEVDRRVS